MLDFFQQYTDELIIISITSFTLLFLTILITPWLVGKIPVDYFINQKYDNPQQSLLLVSLKNILGFILLLLGFIMLFTPGQGIITIIYGLFLMQFPGKRKLEKKIIKNTQLRTALNWLRAKNNKDNLKWN
ncbi:hypothetical protein MNB_SUP05-5-963 [hydrothermal vent metagenome]|uniref:Transmembrane protein (PGPGW) n=1 Tax=hydrothermal vent metagenome TaxID=652676 RepID=A0A1W1CE43_9ZZZZ